MITRSGCGLAVVTAALLASWPVLGYPELVALGVTGALALATAALWMASRPQVRVVRRIEPTRVVEGGEAHGVLTVTNTGRRRCPPFLAIEASAITACGWRCRAWPLEPRMRSCTRCRWIAEGSTRSAP